MTETRCRLCGCLLLFPDRMTTADPGLCNPCRMMLEQARKAAR